LEIQRANQRSLDLLNETDVLCRNYGEIVTNKYIRPANK